jgi:hypothetical protein
MERVKYFPNTIFSDVLSDIAYVTSLDVGLLYIQIHSYKAKLHYTEHKANSHRLIVYNVKYFVWGKTFQIHA